MIQKLGGGAIYCNAKGQTLRQVKERRWPLLIVVKKSYKLQVTRKGKATIRVRVPPLISGSQIQHLRICPELLKSCICDPENLGGG